MIPFYPQKLISHALILGMIIVFFLQSIIPNLISVFGFHPIFLWVESIPIMISQLTLFQFLHGDVLHLFMNSIFLYQAWPEIEVRMSKQRFIIFFIFSTLFIGWALALFSNGLTIGMSGFCMALLSYLWLDLSRVHHPAANQILIMLVMNILLWLSGGISFTAHAAGAIFGIVWWHMYKKR